MKRILYIALLSLLVFSCKDEEIQSKDSLILEGYIFEGKPVDNIRVSRLGGFGETNENVPVDDAVVVIIYRGEIYLLESTGEGEGKYIYNGNDLPVISGDRYDIAVLHEDDTLFGATTVPPRPTGLAQSANVIKTDPFARDSISIVTVWNQNHDFWSPVIISMEDNPEEIPFDERFRFSFSTPSTDTFFEINRIHLTYYGQNALVVYSVNSEYVILFDSENPENFFESPTNINNGFGIFTAFSSDSLFFQVVE